MGELLTERWIRKPAPLTGTLPDIDGVPELYRGTEYTLGGNNWLIGDGDNNPKLVKNENGGQYKSYGLTLSPAKTSGVQVCSSSTPGCRKVCLHYQGHARVFGSIHAARIARTLAFSNHREWFQERLAWELERIRIRSEESGLAPCVRLNVMSDVMWEKVYPKLFSDNPGIQFYDYTKHFSRMKRWCKGNLPPNYHLTYSRSELNDEKCLQILQEGGTVTVVFSGKAIPTVFKGYPVVNGDETDLRFLDPKGHWVGLYAKGTAKRDTSGFVVNYSLAA